MAAKQLRLGVNNWSWREVGLLAFVGLFVVAGIWSSAQDQPEIGRASSDDFVAAGRLIFWRERCFFCHALNDESSASLLLPSSFVANSGPDLSAVPRRTDDWHLAHLIDPQAVVAGSTMPSFASLPESELRALVAFVQSLNTSTQPTPSPPEVIPSVPDTLEAYRSGQRLYAAHCAGCHGEFGNGAGPVGHLLQPEPRDFTAEAWMARRSDEYLYSVIANGLPDTAMPGYRNTLDPKERALLLRYIRYFADPVARQFMEQGLPVSLP